MSDEFDRRDWMEDLNEGIRNGSTWLRGLKILVLMLFLAVARLALIVIVFYQFCFCLVRNRPSELVFPVGAWLARYVEKVILFVTWYSDHAPFPFSHINRVLDEEPDYWREDYGFAPEEGEGYAGAEDRDDEQPPSPPAPDEMRGAESEQPPESGDEVEEDEDRGNRPPRPDA
jgi:hypothetical protein